MQVQILINPVDITKVGANGLVYRANRGFLSLIRELVDNLCTN
jgi:hypothetical protein